MATSSGALGMGLGQALGAKEQSAAANFQWGDQFWIDVYNKSASKLT
jgi:hypothetical protein